MAERIANGPEHGAEQNKEALDAARQERSAELERDLERRVENAPERNVETSLAEAKEAAAKAEKAEVKAAPKTEKHPVTRKQRKAQGKASYKRTMKEAQAQMSAPQRSFSKTIHNPVVEKTSEVVGSTVARPNAILAGSVTAFLFTLVIYLVAKYYGYPLSGTETIAGFILGWAVGLLFDYLRVMVTGKRA
jgi:hypothetical protein